MSDTTTTIQNASLGASVTTGILPVIAQNATAISVICTFVFGLIYASCAIWNGYSNHKRNQVNRRKIVEDLIDEIESSNAPKESKTHLIEMLRK